jgi:hypothetical protein
MSSITVWPELRALANATCEHFKLRLTRLEPYAGSDLACCETRHRGHNVIRLRVHVYGRPTKPLARSTLTRLLAHELAHLRFHGHGQEWKEFQQAILNYWRDEGWL